MRRHLIWTPFLLICLFGCSRTPQGAWVAESGSVVSTPPDPRPVILAFGDSLTAGHGVELQQSYPSQLQRLLDQRGYKYRVVNAGVGGDTTGGGLPRMDAALQFHPKVVVLELGANDGLRGLPIRQAKANLERMIV